MSTKFIEAHNKALGVTKRLPASALPYLDGWEPVDPDEVPTPAVVDGSVDEVLARVGDDPTVAAHALAAEQSRSKPRSTLVDALSRLIDTEES